MNALRRLLLFVFSVLLLAAAGGLIALAWNQDQKLDLSAGDFNLQAFVIASDGAKWAFTLVMALFALAGFAGLALSLMRASAPGPGKGALMLKQADGGMVEVSATAIETLLREDLQTLPGIRRVAPTVRLADGAVQTHLDAVIEPGESIAHATKSLGDAVYGVLREQVGVTSVRRPVIRISYDEMAAIPAGGAPVRRDTMPVRTFAPPASMPPPAPTPPEDGPPDD